MRTEIVYVAEDETRFMSQTECEKYEKECRRKKRTEYLTHALDVDMNMWRKFCEPDAADTNLNPQLAFTWLKHDIEYILVNDLASIEEIIEFIAQDEYGDKIVSDLAMSSIMKNVRIRKDFKSAFATVKYGDDLAGDLDYVFSMTDLSNLAKLHKSGACQKKIEDLLTACNFHSECSKFINKEYSDFILD